MAKVMTINDFPLYAQMVADLINREGGHEVKMLLSPIIVDEVVAFGPDVIIVSLVRKLEVIGHGGLHDFYTEVDGAKSYRQIATAPELEGIPLILSAIGVREVDVPQDVSYLAFVHMPQELELLLTALGNIERARAHGGRPLES